MDTAPHDGRMLLTAELPVVLVALERMLGGRPETASQDRELTDIDLMVVHRLFGTIVEALSSVWFDIAEMTLQHRQRRDAGRDGAGHRRRRADARR